ncbi:MAG TPA: hypothetical protein VLG38_03350 [Gammaproteobacteria bacterium]|nr:hypothetical protein [Gammaproteobacteria bacterium]
MSVSTTFSLKRQYLLLGKYAILQDGIAAKLFEYYHARTEKHDLFARFIQPTKVINATTTNVSVIEPDTETEKLISLTKGSQENLFIAKTVFPFVLFTDTLKIDRQKLTIVHNDMLRMSQTGSIELRNIMNIQADVGPLFGSITVTSKHFQNNTQTIKFLRKKDVATAKCLLQGFMIAHRAKIRIDDIEQEQLLALLSELGQENHT